VEARLIADAVILVEVCGSSTRDGFAIAGTLVVVSIFLSEVAGLRSSNIEIISFFMAGLGSFVFLAGE